MGRVVHFEFPVDDPERAIEFYQKVFGWRVTVYEGPVDYWLISTGTEGEPGIDGALGRRSEHLPTEVNTVQVDDVDAALQRIEAAGGSALTPKVTIPGVGFMAYCLDTEGTRFGIMQSDPDAQPTGPA